MLHLAAAAALLHLLLLVDSGAASIASFKRPACEPSEPCRYEIGGFPVQFCSCPGKSARCPAAVGKHSLDFLGVRYQFCAPVAAELCEPGAVAWIRRGLRQFVKCVCPEPLTLRSKQWDKQTDITEYTCEAVEYCTPGIHCAVREHIEGADGGQMSHLTQTCDCAPPFACRMTQGSVVLGGNQVELGFCA